MKLELVVPTSLSEIPLGHYQKFLEVAKNTNDDEFLGQKMIEIFCGIELKEVVKIAMPDVINLVSHFNKLFSEIPKFKNRFEINGVEFGFIPNMEKISWGEYISIDKTINDYQNLNVAMGVMYRPIIEFKKDKYLVEKYNAEGYYDDLMKYAPLDVCLSAQLFFWNLEKELLIATISYLEKMMSRKMQMSLLKKLNLVNDGVGIKAYISSLKEMLEDLMKLPTLNYLPALTFSHSKSKKQKLKSTN